MIQSLDRVQYKYCTSTLGSRRSTKATERDLKLCCVYLLVRTIRIVLSILFELFPPVDTNGVKLDFKPITNQTKVLSPGTNVTCGFTNWGTVFRIEE